MATQWLSEFEEQLVVNDGQKGKDIFNTKEDAEVLKGLFIGRYAHQQFSDAHKIKQLKMWDIL